MLPAVRYHASAKSSKRSCHWLCMDLLRAVYAVSDIARVETEKKTVIAFPRISGWPVACLEAEIPKKVAVIDFPWISERPFAWVEAEIAKKVAVNDFPRPCDYLA